MIKLVCKNCKSNSVEYEDYCGGTSYYRCKTCGQRGNKDKFTQKTLFDRFTASPEVLAETYMFNYDGKVFKSLLLPNMVFNSREEAHIATVARLKEVEK